MRSRTAAAAASLPRTVAPAPATYGRVDHIAMVVLATVGCLLLLAPQREPNTATHAVPRPPSRSPQPSNCRILNSTLKLSSCDDNYDHNYVYPLLITGVGRSGTRFAAKTLTALGYDVAHDDARCGRVGAASWPLAIREGAYHTRPYQLPNFATINSGFRGPNPRWRFRRVFHQTRDPLRTILSRANSVGMMVSPWRYSDPLLFRDGLGYCPGFPPVAEFAAWREDRTAVERGPSWTLEMRASSRVVFTTFSGTIGSAPTPTGLTSSRTLTRARSRAVRLWGLRGRRRARNLRRRRRTLGLWTLPSQALLGRTSSGSHPLFGGARRGWRASLGTTTEFKRAICDLSFHFEARCDGVRGRIPSVRLTH